MISALDEALKAEKIIIYGAHLVAVECARWFIKEGLKDRLIGFAVTDMEGNPREILKLPVKRIEDYAEEKDSIIMIATPEKYHTAVEQHARDKGFTRFLKISLEEMSAVKGRYLIEEQQKYKMPFTLEISKNDVSWLDMYGLDKNKNRHYKFPTLFYLDTEAVFREASALQYEEDFKAVCGEYSSLSSLEEIGKGKANIENPLKIYMVFTESDSAFLYQKQYEPWIVPIQAGSKIAGRKYGIMYDDTGDNISDKNSLFAEMTGAYWIWKHDKATKYKGLCHYRRHFDISGAGISALESNDIDVILTTPRYVPGGVGKMFLAETPVKEEVYQNMLASVRDIHCGEEKDFKGYMESRFYYPNNMVIAKNDIYNDYCGWVFPVLFRMLEIDKESGYDRMDGRHIAYAAELLTSYFFVKNKDRYHVAVTDYRFYASGSIAVFK